MIESLALPLLAGVALGLFFFGGLWWTVRKGTTAANPALWFLGSFLLRTCVALGGFYAVGAGDWRRLLAALVGFVLARLLLTRFSPAPLSSQERSHAP
jgi:F1F0 ATPase subunit 2